MKNDHAPWFRVQGDGGRGFASEAIACRGRTLVSRKKRATVPIPPTRNKRTSAFRMTSTHPNFSTRETSARPTIR